VRRDAEVTGVSGTLPRLILVRHGETLWSREGRHTGRTDVPLTEEGRVEAASAREQLAALSPGQVLCSPSVRAAETCRLAGFGQSVETVDDLYEWDYGDYEGLTTEQIRAERPGWSLWADGVPNGETDVLCFAHGHVLRVLAARWVGLPAIGGRLLALRPASLSVLGWEHEAPVIERWNEPPPSR
jgi:probable phosphoglycerate mutase